VLIPILGKAFCDAQKRNVGGDKSCRIQRTALRVQIGADIFSCKAREMGRAVFRSRASWFCIRKENVPHYAMPAPDADAIRDPKGNALLYGRFHEFLQITIKAWELDDYYGHCRLYEGAYDQKTAAHIINLEQTCKWSDPAKGNRMQDIEYVKLSYIEGMIALAPTYTNLLTSKEVLENPRKKQPPPTQNPALWYVLRLEK
jgi:hypothetical protein